MGPPSNPYFEVLLLLIAPGTIVSSSHGERKPGARSKKKWLHKKKKE
jgi:hypothetical protein